MPAAAKTITPFKYIQPEKVDPKKILWMARTDRLFTLVQVIRAGGGETNLHSHPNTDGVWFVLSGRARFYSDETTVVADLGPMEGVIIPRGEKYWFEAAGDDLLEILQVECSTKAVANEEEAMADRIDFTAKKADYGKALLPD